MQAMEKGRQGKTPEKSESRIEMRKILRVVSAGIAGLVFGWLFAA